MSPLKVVGAGLTVLLLLMSIVTAIALSRFASEDCYCTTRHVDREGTYKGATSVPGRLVLNFKSFKVECEIDRYERDPRAWNPKRPKAKR